MRFTKVFIDLVKISPDHLRYISLMAVEIDGLRFRVVGYKCFEDPAENDLKQILEETIEFSKKFTKEWSNDYIIASLYKAREIDKMYSKYSVILPFEIFGTEILANLVSDIKERYASEIVAHTPHLNKIAKESEKRKENEFDALPFYGCFCTAIIYGYVKAVMSSIETLKKLAGKL